MGMLFDNYDPGQFFDEMFEPSGQIRTHYDRLYQRYSELTPEEFERKTSAADNSFLNQGITFTVYNNAEGTERIFPFDLLPRIVPFGQWQQIEQGLVQRITELKLFLHDDDDEQLIIK